MKHCIQFFSLVCLFATINMSAHANPAATSKQCTVKDRSESLVIMVCPPHFDNTAWKDAGKAACVSALMCNVWIWEDAAKAPNKAPATDSDLPKSHVATAVAIWVNDSESLISLRKVK
ncbi:conserved exported hypothetical protein [Candidatus Nitrotoga sp. M5]|nr:conserved exported hypothetical protein [Candidatus Nitrotoga sp. M5]